MVYNFLNTGIFLLNVICFPKSEKYNLRSGSSEIIEFHNQEDTEKLQYFQKSHALFFLCMLSKEAVKWAFATIVSEIH